MHVITENFASENLMRAAIVAKNNFSSLLAARDFLGSKMCSERGTLTTVYHRFSCFAETISDSNGFIDWQLNLWANWRRALSERKITANYPLTIIYFSSQECIRRLRSGEKRMHRHYHGESLWEQENVWFTSMIVSRSAPFWACWVTSSTTRCWKRSSTRWMLTAQANLSLKNSLPSQHASWLRKMLKWVVLLFLHLSRAEWMKILFLVASPSRPCNKSSRKLSDCTTRKVRKELVSVPSGIQRIPLKLLFYECVSFSLQKAPRESFLMEAFRAQNIHFHYHSIAGNGYITTAVLKEILRELDDTLTNDDLDAMIEGKAINRCEIIDYARYGAFISRRAWKRYRFRYRARAHLRYHQRLTSNSIAAFNWNID